MVESVGENRCIKILADPGVKGFKIHGFELSKYINNP